MMYPVGLDSKYGDTVPGYYDVKVNGHFTFMINRSASRNVIYISRLTWVKKMNG